MSNVILCVDQMFVVKNSDVSCLALIHDKWCIKWYYVPPLCNAFNCVTCPQGDLNL